jgi:hypothetical protein
MTIRFWGKVLGAGLLGVAVVAAAAQAQPKPQPAAKTAPAAPARPLSDSERKVADELTAEQKQLDTDGARVMAASPDGRRRVPEAIAKQFNVPDKVVNDLRAKRMGYGDVTIALALSQQLMKREKALTQQQALDRVLAVRKAGQGWGAVARDLGLKLGDVVGEVKRTDKQLSKLDTVRAAKAEKTAR